MKPIRQLAAFTSFALLTTLGWSSAAPRADFIRQESVKFDRSWLRLLAVRGTRYASPPTAKIQRGPGPLQTCVACDGLRPRAQFRGRLRPRGNRWPLEGEVRLQGKYGIGIPDGVPLDDGYATWHSDGTEIMNSGRVPKTGSFVWEYGSKLADHIIN